MLLRGLYNEYMHAGRHIKANSEHDVYNQHEMPASKHEKSISKHERGNVIVMKRVNRLIFGLLFHPIFQTCKIPRSLSFPEKPQASSPKNRTYKIVSKHHPQNVLQAPNKISFFLS